MGGEGDTHAKKSTNGKTWGKQQKKRRDRVEKGSLVASMRDLRGEERRTIGLPRRNGKDGVHVMPFR